MTRRACPALSPSETPTRSGWRLAVAALALGVLAGGGALAEDPQPGESLYPLPKDGHAPRSDPAPSPEDDPRVNDDRFNVLSDDDRVAGKDQNEFEYELYNDLLGRARRFSPEVFAKHARGDYTPAHLMGADRASYRGDIVHVEGYLRRLRWMKANAGLAQQYNVTEIYEGWIEPKPYQKQPICVLFTEMPEGLKPAEKMSRWVNFDGYYFKVYVYSDEAGKLWRAPLLIGRTVQLPPRPEERSWLALTGDLVPVVGTLMGLFAVAVLGLSWWFRSGDRRLRARLDERQSANPFAAGPPVVPDRAADDLRRRAGEPPNWMN